MNTAEVVKKLIPLLGGVENIASATHCATRLRLVLHDDTKGDKVAIDRLDSVKGCFANAGQFQIIFGTGLVNEIYDEFIKETDIEQRSKSEVNSIASQKQNIIQRCATL
ncbi:glucose PTS transporter subunit EIIB [Zooshikella ganghwensis]|uniref:glucose PTS transporter subunit EIIB n=1 Tax=Zooshikella ganghwensis TaxID=202772 RepID=UPI0003FF46B5|nr:glucose PTS transporter subunit EIIB [Zooshikella ganghwensis]